MPKSVLFPLVSMPRLPVGLAALLLALAVPVAHAQETDSTRAEEVLLDQVEDESAGESITERIEALRLSPLDLNTATADDLTDLPGVSLLLAERIVAHRERVGGFRSLPELTAVPGMTEQIYGTIRPFLRLGEASGPAQRRASPYPAVPTFAQIRSDLRLDAVQRVGRRLGTARSDTSGAYVGDPLRTTTRLRLKSRQRFDASLILDTDAGERAAFDLPGGRIASDYASAGVLVRGFGRVETAVVGDFQARFGQGLVAWRPGSLGKSREATRGVARSGDGLTLHASAEETRFLRGGGLAFRVTPTVTVTAFGSRRRLDASSGEDSTSFTTIGTTGLHRTASEIARRGQLGETHGGVAVRLRRGAFDGGVVATATRFDDPLRPDSNAARRFAARGTDFSAVSAFGHGRVRSALVFGEVARSQTAPFAGFAGVLGVLAPLGRGNEIVVAARSYGRDFVSRFGDAFGEGSGLPQNEQGLYTGLTLRASPTLVASAYLDAYRFPWVRTTTPRPSTGLDALAATEWRPRRWFAVITQLRSETRDEGATVLDALGRERATTLPETRQSARLHGEYTFSRALLLRSRVELVRFVRSGEDDKTGTILYQDVLYTPEPVWRGLRLSVNARLAAFDTDGFDARVYAYESDVRYGFSVPALAGRGTRAYVLLRAYAGRITAEARYAVTRYEDVETVGSGQDIIAGPRSRDVKVQLSLRL